MSEIIFEVTKQHLETGLRGYPVGYCTTSSVDAQKGLSYVGHSISEFGKKDPVEIIYMLIHGREGESKEVALLSQDLQKRASLSDKVMKSIQGLPKEGHPMKLFSSAILIAGMLESTGDYKEDCLNIIAKIPLIAATVIAHHAGWELNKSKPELGYMENFNQMLAVPNANPDELLNIFKVFNILHYDHGGGNLSAFVGKSVASGLEDMYGSLASSMCALAGPRHGKANQDCLEFTKVMLEHLGENASVSEVEELLKEKLKNKELIYGFGHAVLRVEDPRASIFYEMASELYADHPLIRMAMLLREAGPKVLKENPKVSNPYPNVDAISGALLTAGGFPFPEYYTVLFGLSRIVGIAVQIVYERCTARDGKGVAIYRPKYFYKGNS
ncbi:MAG: Citrate synthase [Chlamydiae bacterium]|nr:Citrate synthase [Chlamydiota bacterium]